ncbi:uncharacterized protein LOC144621977 isoform X1 [Crassostrea virginica]
MRKRLSTAGKSVSCHLGLFRTLHASEGQITLFCTAIRNHLRKKNGDRAEFISESAVTMGRKRRENPFEVALKWCKNDADPPGFEIDIFQDKGRGIRTSFHRRNGDFLLHYAGEVISADEGERREIRHPSVFRYFFRNLCVDATEESGRLGRLVNHGGKHERNAVMKVVGETNLCLFAIRDIKETEEILYDYGHGNLPWLKKEALAGDGGEPDLSGKPEKLPGMKSFHGEKGISDQMDREGFSDECREPDLLDVAGEQSGADDPGDPGFEGSHGPPGPSTPMGFERDDGHDGLPGVSGMRKEDETFGFTGPKGDTGIPEEDGHVGSARSKGVPGRWGFKFRVGLHNRKGGSGRCGKRCCK